MKRLWISIVCCLFLLQSKGADTLRVNGANNIPIAGYLDEFVDCGKNMTAESVWAAWERGAFQPSSPGYFINKGVGNCTYWFVLNLKNTYLYRQDYLWSFYNDAIQFVLYEVDKSGDLRKLDSISHRKVLSERTVPLRSLSFVVPLESNESKRLLLSVNPVGRKNVYFPTDISSYRDILAFELNFSFLLGRYYGFFFFAIIFNLSLYIVLRRRFYGVMLGYVLSLFAFNMVEYLHDVYLVPEVIYPYWSMIPKQTFLALTLYFNVLVFQNFVNLDHYLPKVNRVLRSTNKVLFYSICLFVLITLSVPNIYEFAGYLGDLFVVVMLSQFLVLLTSCLLCGLKQVPNFFHYLAGVSPLLLAVVFYLISTFDLGHFKQWILPGNIIFAFAFEVVYLMIVFTVMYKREFDRFSKEVLALYNSNKQLSNELISVQERERMRISQDIHDGLGGAIQGLRLLLSTEDIKQKNKLDYFLKKISVDFRRLVYKLYPNQLKKLGLCHAIKEDASRYNGPIISVTCMGDDTIVPQDMQVAVYRIYQELLTNAIKHADGVSVIQISLAIDDTELRLMIEDDGRKQWDIDSKEARKGVGLLSIRARVDYCEGEMHVESMHSGTSVIITLPLN